MRDGGGTTRDRVLAEAKAWVGTPYHHQASLKGVGTDCLGLVRGIWRAVVGEEPEAPPAYSPDWGDADGRETLIAAARRHLVEKPAGAPLQAGDVLVFRWREMAVAKHAGVAIGSDRMIHAYEGAGVVEATLTPCWRRRIAAVFTFPEV